MGFSMSAVSRAPVLFSETSKGQKSAWARLCWGIIHYSSHCKSESVPDMQQGWGKGLNLKNSGGGK